MIERKQLLEDLQSLLSKTIEPDLRERSELPEIKAALTEEFEKAKKAERTALNFTVWRADYITQIGVGWVLSCVFIRFLEDNDLIDPPKLSGPAQGDGESQTSLQRARDEYDLYIKSNPTHSFREYILSCVDELAKLPGVSDVFGDKNVIHQQRDWLSNDAAKALYNFWQKIEPETGSLIHNFVDDSETETFDTRFLGDLYQDLSEAARKKYALLQTPDFVEEFILDRTLEPALDEFGLQPGSNASDRDSLFKMIDPACGSGHFLLGAFPRILLRWQQKEPGTKVDVLVQRTLHSIHGVDINPFAIAIARFRLLLASLKACGIERLRDAIDFDMSNLACGDSLYHGRQKQGTLGDWTEESHYFQTEDADNLKRILRERTFHAVVANPPYITVKDTAPNQTYRQLYSSCSGKYSLSVPFLERILDLGITGNAAGFSGQITSNSFMKRVFGRKLIEKCLPNWDVTHILDTSGADIPGHGTPTAIIFARSRKPSSKTIRAVCGLKEEVGELDNPREGLVWQAIIQLLDMPNAMSEYISVDDVDRVKFGSHPWDMGGGAVSALQEKLVQHSIGNLKQLSDTGFGVVTLEDDAFVRPRNWFARHRNLDFRSRPFVDGGAIREWVLKPDNEAIFPYSATHQPTLSKLALRSMWPLRANLKNRLWFKKTQEDRGLAWFEFGHFSKSKITKRLGIVCSDRSSHNHFALMQGAEISNQGAPLLNLPEEATKNEYNEITAILNSSVTLFWFRVKCFAATAWRVTLESWDECLKIHAGAVESIPVSKQRGRLSLLVDTILSFTEQNSLTASDILAGLPGQNLRSVLENQRVKFEQSFRAQIGIQEEIDWECYQAYGLEDCDSACDVGQWFSFGINLGERAFEIVMARKMTAGELQTTWFERHGSTPITEIPDHWPNDYKQLVQRRIDVIESNPQIALIEQPEYKRRWNTEPWESQVERALKSWLLDRLESYFDFDGRMEAVSDQEPEAERRPSPLADIQLVSVAKLADVASQDPQFMEVAEVYRDRADFDLVKLVDELVSEEHVPALPILRYKPSGLDKRKAWEETWELQRAEDKIEARIREQLDGLLEMGGKNKDKEGAFRKDLPRDSPVLEFFSHVEVEKDDAGEEKKTTIQDGFLTVDEIVRRCVAQEMGEIPVPPKYASKDMISTGGAKYWKLRGKLDVPKERWVSFPRCEGEDQTLVIAWAGYDHLQLLKAIAAYFADVQERGGSEDPRLVPLLAAMDQQIPWVKQWHNDIDPDFNMRLGDYFADFINDEARNLGLTLDDIRAWEPPKKVKKKRAKKKATKKTAKTE